MSPSNQIPLRRVSLALLAIGTACLIAACGSSSSGTTSTSTVASASGSSASSFAARRTALVACLKQHGVTLPSRPPGSGGPGSGRTGTATAPRGGGPPAGGVFFGGGAGGGRFRQLASNPKMQAAFKACGANFRFRAGRGFGRISHQTINNYVACVRRHGYNLPAPNFSGKGSVFPAKIRTNPKFQAASRSCQKLLIPPRPGSSSSGTTTAGA